MFLFERRGCCIFVRKTAFPWRITSLQSITCWKCNTGGRLNRWGSLHIPLWAIAVLRNSSWETTSLVHLTLHVLAQSIRIRIYNFNCDILHHGRVLVRYHLATNKILASGWAFAWIYWWHCMKGNQSVKHIHNSLKNPGGVNQLFELR